ncbi:MAG: tetratricopeptide repeat protein [Thermodesulfovibrionales bacterium]
MTDKTAIMQEVQKYIMKGQTDKAIAELEKLLREGPDGNTFNAIGDLYLKKGDKKNSAEYHRKAAAYFREEGFSLKALALYKKVLNTNTADADALYALGELSEEKSLVTDAIKYYLAAADSLSKEGEKGKMIRMYQKILALSPENIPLRVKVAETLLKEGLINEACKEYAFIAKVFDEKGEVDKSKEYFQKVLGLRPSDKDSLMGLAHVLERSGDAKNALLQVKKAVEAYDDDNAIKFTYAELLTRAGRNADAMACILKIREADPGNMKVRQLLADNYLSSGQMDRAWEEYMPLIEQMVSDEKYDNAQHYLELFREVEPVETGKRLIELAKHLRDDDRLAAELLLLGDVYRERGLTDEAAECLRGAAEVKPYDEEIQRKLRAFTPEPPGEEPATEPAGEIQAPDEVKIVSSVEKTAEEVFVEADIFTRYGLMNEAIKILESLKMREPQNLDVHLRLKAAYEETADKESAVTECLILSELYKRSSDPENAEKMLQQAMTISPGDPRLEGRVAPSFLEPTMYSGTLESTEEEPPEETGIEDYEDSLAEADFYIRQGLTQEASKILERMHSLFPENKDIIERLETMGVITESFEPSVTLGGGVEDLPEEPAEPEETVPEIEITDESLPGEFSLEDLAEKTAADGTETYMAETPGFEFPASEAEEPEPGIPEPVQAKPAEAAPPAQEEYEDFTLTDQDLVEAEEMPELALDNDVLEIFQEFKKGLAQELGEEDSETHYNLGIAYKEMGLVDDAIKEFQMSRNDPKRMLQSSTMLGVCYMEQGLYSLAVEVLRKVASEGNVQDESYWPIRYDLADALEKSNNLKEALDLYTSVYGWNAGFRNVSEKLSQLKARIGAGGAGEPSVKPAKPERPEKKKDRVSYL